MTLLQWQCLNCGKDFEGDDWFCCDRCKDNYTHYEGEHL